MANRPEPEVEITTELVRALLQDQFPELASRSLRPLSRGWDNTNFRLGDDSIVRVPHREAAAPLIVHEQRWLPMLAPKIDLAIPAPTHAGVPQPGRAYPWHWSVTPWFAGDEAAGATVTSGTQTAIRLGEFFRQVHVAAPDDAPNNPYRGCPISDRRGSFEANLAAIGPGVDKRAIAAVFNQACDVPASTQRVWLHGDLHTRNMIVANGELTAVIDWGDICTGDRATDLAGAFMLVPDDIAVVTRHAGASAEDWERARGWAINFAVIYLANSDDDPVMGAIGTRLLDTLT